MRKFLIPTKDTTIYQAYTTSSAGFDEILEVGKVVNRELVEPSYVSASARSLLYFELPTTASVPATASYFLNLKLANADNINRNQKILVYRVSQSWDEGSGYFYQTPRNVNDGATWKQATTTVSWSLAGGDFLTSTSASTTLSTYPLQDLRIDVTDLIRPYVSQSLQNTFYGLALQFPISDEISSVNKGNIKVFSSQTHTVHQPTLEIAWDDQSFSTGSLSAIPSVNVKVVENGIQQEYKKNDVARINLTVRDEYPVKSFDSTLRYKNKYYLPTSSFYSIVDVQANVIIVPFDTYSKISCDSNGSYFNLDTAPLYAGRFYKLVYQIQTGSYTRTVPSDILFKII